MIQVTCPGCGRRFETDDQYAGAAAKCPSCGADLVIPAPAAPPTGTAPLQGQAAPPPPSGFAPPPQTGYAPPPMPDPGVYVPERTSALAIWALVLGVLGVVGCIPLGLVGVVLGIIALSAIKKPGSGLGGGGMAVAGIALGGVSLVLTPCLIGILLPALGASRRTANQMKNSTHLRGQHQAMVIFAQSNNSYLTGLDASGEVLEDGPATGDSGPGSTASARYWILLNAQYTNGALLINPVEATSGAMSPWMGGGPVTTANHSYAMLRIADPDGDAGRLAEWKDNANSQAVLISDRNIGPSSADTQVQSLWTSALGDWKGNLVWGDNHAEFNQSNRGFTTRYLASSTVGGDNLFADGPIEPGATETGTTPGANAMMEWD